MQTEPNFAMPPDDWLGWILETRPASHGTYEGAVRCVRCHVDVALVAVVKLGRPLAAAETTGVTIHIPTGQIATPVIQTADCWRECNVAGNSLRPVSEVIRVWIGQILSDQHQLIKPTSFRFHLSQNTLLIDDAPCSVKCQKDEGNRPCIVDNQRSIRLQYCLGTQIISLLSASLLFRIKISRLRNGTSHSSSVFGEQDVANIPTALCRSLRC